MYNIEYGITPRTLTERERNVLLPAIKKKLGGSKTDDEIEKALNDYMKTAEDAPTEHVNKTDEEIVEEVITLLMHSATASGGRRTKSSKKRATRRRRSSKRKSRKMNKRRK
jgi:hypothetical protein